MIRKIVKLKQLDRLPNYETFGYLTDKYVYKVLEVTDTMLFRVNEIESESNIKTYCNRSDWKITIC